MIIPVPPLKQNHRNNCPFRRMIVNRRLDAAQAVDKGVHRVGDDLHILLRRRIVRGLCQRVHAIHPRRKQRGQGAHLILQRRDLRRLRVNQGFQRVELSAHLRR